MLVLRDVSKVYRSGDRPALDGVSLEVRPGELVALLGPSGAGKSTFLRCVNGLVAADAGRVCVAGEEVTKLSAKDLQGLRRQVGMIFQELNLIDRLPVLTNVIAGRFGRYPFWRAALGLFPAEDVAAARRLLGRVGLAEFEQSRARELSGGQRQRVAVARAMMQEPALLLGDEPVASLDPVTAAGVLALIAELTAERNLATVLSLHDPNLAREYCGRVIGLREGRIVFDGPAGSLSDDALAAIYGRK